MYCPNGNLTLNQLLDMLFSKEYDIWFEPDDKPEDWDWKKNGFYPSPLSFFQSKSTHTAEFRLHQKVDHNCDHNSCQFCSPFGVNSVNDTRGKFVRI